MKKNSQKIKGIIPPIITPLLDSQTLDHAGLERLVEHVIGGGVHGLFILGTTGEGPSLPYSVRREVISKCVAAAAGRVPVIVGITDSASQETIALAEYAAETGADAVAWAPPYYFPIGDADLRKYLLSVLPKIPLPVLLYNMPSHTKLSLSIPTLQAVAKDPNVIGIKDSSGDMGYFYRVLKMAAEDRPDWSVLIGSENLLPDAIYAGGDGCVPGGANIFPSLFVKMYDACAARREQEIKTHQADILNLERTLYCEEGGSPGAIKGVKFALSRLGICQNVLAEPLHPCGQPTQAIIQNLLDCHQPR